MIDFNVFRGVLLFLSLSVSLLSFGNAFGNTFKFRLLADPTSLDWHIASTLIETPILMNIMEGLTEVDSNLKPKPALAEKMIVSSDQKTYTFILRKNIKWSDGKVLKAQDFVESWKRLLTPSTAAPYAYLLYEVVGAQEFHTKIHSDFSKVGILAKDDLTFQVTLKQPVAYFPFLTGFWPLFPIRKDVIDQNGSQWTKPGKLVSLGPYVLDFYQVQNKIVLKANPHYWRERGNLSEITAQIVKDSTTAMNLFKSGQLQMMQDFSPDDLKLARPMPEFKTFPYLKTHYIGFKVKGTIAENKYLRLAIAHAFDRKPIPAILNGSQKNATSFIPPRVVGHDPKMGLAYDVKLAKEYLSKSGWDLKKPIELISRNSDRPRIVTQYIQSELKRNLGLNVSIQNFDHKMFRSTLQTGTSPMFLNVWSADYPDGDTFLGLFETGTGNNMTKFSDPKFDERIRKARTDWNSLKREKLYREAQHLLQEAEAAVIPLFYEENEALIGKRVKGFSINPIGYFFLRQVSVN